MSRKGGDDEHGRLVAGLFLAKMQEPAERMRGDDLFGHANLLAVDGHLADAEFRPIVRHPGIGEQFHRRRRASHQRSILDQRPWLGQHAAEELGHQSNRSEYVAVYLVRVVKHISSNLPAPALATSKLSKRFPFRSIQRRNPSHPKTFAISRVYLYCQSFRQELGRSAPRALQLSDAMFENLVNALFLRA